MAVKLGHWNKGI